ncbi:uncharacterized protein LOC109948854 [Prunus persica]|uniref:uncharacterized protein LOC109948854 n=1 Tax=Prunus persica TaxID=3760 RepID=UPI0009AB30C6|nr:uncharacterized protein LOC109948854 [Prunus persica]
MIDSNSVENGSGRLPTIRDIEQRSRKKGVRGACKAVKTTRIVRTSNNRIKVIFHPKYNEPVDEKISSMLSHDLGAIIRNKCPMNHGYWEDVLEDKKKDLTDEITVNFDIDLDIAGHRGYIDLVMARRFRDFKHELHKHFQLFSSPEEALAKPPLEIIERDAVHEWKYLCEHFQSQDFLRASNANKANRSKKKMEHRAGSLSFSHIVMQCAEEGSQFAEIDAFEKAYAGKNKQWTNETAKAKYDEMVAKKNEYLKELAKEYPEGTPLDEMSIANQDVGRNIVMDVLGKKPGRQKRRLGFGRVRGSKTSSSPSLASSTRLQQLEDQLVAERTAREAIQNYLQKIVQQISSIVPLFVPPPADFLVTPETEHVDDEDHDHTSLE